MVLDVDAVRIYLSEQKRRERIAASTGGGVCSRCREGVRAGGVCRVDDVERFPTDVRAHLKGVMASHDGECVQVFRDRRCEICIRSTSRSDLLIAGDREDWKC